MTSHDREYIRRRTFVKTFAKRIETFAKRAIATLFALLLRTKPRNAPLDPDRISSVLILRYDGIGDMVLTSPMWRILKSHHPNIKIGVAGSQRNLDAIAADTDIDYRYDFSETSLRTLLRGILSARKERWDVVLACVYKNKTKGAIVARLVARDGATSVLARDHFSHYQKLFSIVAKVPYGDTLTSMQDLLKEHFAETIAIKFTDAEWHPSVRIDSTVDREMSDRLQQLLSSVGATHYYHLNVESALKWKEWGMENSLELSKRLIERDPTLSIFWTATPARANETKQFLDTHAAGPKIRLIPTKGLQELMSVVRHAVLVITPDTSIVHLATAEHKPTVALYPEPTEWMPYHVPARVLYPAKGSPVETIEVDAVYRAVVGEGMRD